jgi:hypothetical protein
MPDARAGIAPSAVQAGGAAASPSFETLDAARRAGVLLLVVEGREYYFQLPDAPDSASRTAKWPAPGAAMRQEHRRNRPPAYSRRLAARKVARNAEHASEPADASDGTQPPAPPQQQQPREDAHAGERVEKRPIDDDCEQPRVRRPHLPPLLPPGLPPPAALAPRKLNFDNDVAEPPPEPPLRARDYATPPASPLRSHHASPFSLSPSSFSWADEAEEPGGGLGEVDEPAAPATPEPLRPGPLDAPRSRSHHASPSSTCSDEVYVPPQLRTVAINEHQFMAINEHRSRALGPRDRRSASQQLHHAGRAWAVDNTRDEDAALNLLHAAERAVAGSSSANVAHTRGSGEGHILRRPMRRGLFAEPRAGPAAPTARRCAAHGCGDSEKFVTHMCGYACPMW